MYLRLVVVAFGALLWMAVCVVAVLIVVLLVILIVGIGLLGTISMTAALLTVAIVVVLMATATSTTSWVSRHCGSRLSKKSCQYGGAQIDDGLAFPAEGAGRKGKALCSSCLKSLVN